ncbi:hypothetical protein CP8484711_1886, partial [Chlamydia psittaci 84-8471/1]
EFSSSCSSPRILAKFSDVFCCN